jgi:hypothetical protein
MLDTLSNLPVVHQAYLIMAIAGFVTFGLTLGWVSIRANLSH